ncbi:MAG: leucyl aminopeptidase [Alphaproteobacteria bacterium]|nr:leucyl aminopeptidase [Alphaproteobacteria bacterium]
MEVVVVLEKVSFANVPEENSSIVVGVYEGGRLASNAHRIDDSLLEIIKKNISVRKFEGKFGDSLSFVSDSEIYNNIILIGLGKKDTKLTEVQFEKLGAKIFCAASFLDETVSVLLSKDDFSTSSEDFLLRLGFGSLLKSWSFDKYKTKNESKQRLRQIVLISDNASELAQKFNSFQKLSEGIFLAREVISEPANVIYPETLAQRAKEELTPLGVEVDILETEKMQELGMHALLGVGQGSIHSPRLAVLRWNGSSNKNDQPVAFVGKGVTFDSGGISIKPDDGMHEMRYDMAGSGVVLGLMKAIASNKLPVNVVGIMALVENMPSGSAQRPGDVIKSMSGQTIEIMSTDAEGRLILADALWYAQEKYNPKAIIDLATLTGAIVVALGHEFAGLFSNCDDLADQIKLSAIETGEKVWRMPLTDHFDKSIDSDIADMMNLSKRGTRAGGTTAAQFLQRFVNGKKWAHIDIAGVETCKDNLFICANNGATGFGVHLLYDLLEKNYIK